MEMPGIGRAAMPAYTADRKTDRKTVQAKGGEQIFKLHGNPDGGDGEKAVASWIDVQSNTSHCIYKTGDFNSENPVYKVKTWDADGRMTERLIDASKIDPHNCDAIELRVYSMPLKEQGMGFDAVLKAAVAEAVNRAEERQKQSFSLQSYLNTARDWVAVVRDMAQTAKQRGDWMHYRDWNNYLSYLTK